MVNKLPRCEDAVAYALERLRNGLPATYTYHNLAHTRDDVMPAAMQLARLSGCTPAEIELARVAAAFHDLGILEVRRQHELAGARLAAHILPQFDFSTLAIEQIIGMIMATRLPQRPQTLLECILADADLDVLGRPDFAERNAALHQEVNCHDGPVNDRDWDRAQLAFLEQHSYFTAAARRLRAAGKRANLEWLRQKVATAAE